MENITFVIELGEEKVTTEEVKLPKEVARKIVDLWYNTHAIDSRTYKELTIQLENTGIIWCSLLRTPSNGYIPISLADWELLPRLERGERLEDILNKPAFKL